MENSILNELFFQILEKSEKSENREFRKSRKVKNFQKVLATNIFFGRKIIRWELFETVFAEVSDHTELILGGKRSFKVWRTVTYERLRTDAYGPLRTVKYRILRA